MLVQLLGYRATQEIERVVYYSAVQCILGQGTEPQVASDECVNVGLKAL